MEALWMQPATSRAIVPGLQRTVANLIYHCSEPDIVEEKGTYPAVEVPAPPSGEQLEAQPTAASDLAAEGARIVIDLEILGGMSTNAHNKYKVCVKKFASSLAREASRLEEEDRAEDVDRPEITTSMVIKANELIRRPPAVRVPTSIPLIAAQSMAFVMAMLTPIFGATLHSAWQWTATIVCGIIALTSQIFAIVAARRK
jgi:hypothetical protein